MMIKKYVKKPIIEEIIQNLDYDRDEIKVYKEPYLKEYVSDTQKSKGRLVLEILTKESIKLFDERFGQMEAGKEYLICLPNGESHLYTYEPFYNMLGSSIIMKLKTEKLYRNKYPYIGKLILPSIGLKKPNSNEFINVHIQHKCEIKEADNAK